MNRTKTNPHAWFFNYITGLEGYNKDFEKVIRESVILDFTNGLTGSLSELYTIYPEQYRKMKADILKQKADELDKARKKLIAVLFAFLKSEKPSPHPLRDFPHKGEGSGKVSMDYVKAVACQSAKVKNFNDIPLNQLKQLYRVFGTKNTKGMSETERKLVWAVFRKENRN